MIVLNNLKSSGMKQDNKVVLFYLFFRGESNILVSNEKYNGGNNESHRKCSEQNFILRDDFGIFDALNNLVYQPS